MNNEPLVSVVVATYRRDKSLKKAINSIINQTYSNIEIIVVDDNDDIDWNKKVSDIVNSVSANTLIQVSIIMNHPNQGSANTRNIGIQKANGNYICFLDDDDVFLPNRIANQLKDMVEFDADYGITDLILYNEDDSINEIRKRHYLIGIESKNILLCHLKYHLTGTDTLMFKREYINAIGGFDPIDLGDEYYLMMKAIVSNGRLKYSPFSDVKAYVHKGDNGLSSGYRKIEGENKLYKYKKTFFSKLSFNDKRYICMRHYAVLAFAFFRMRKLLYFTIYGAFSFFVYPKQCIKLLRNRKKV